MINWLKIAGPLARTPVIPPGKPIHDEQGAQIDGLNFMSAIESHVKWKSRLENYIQGTSNEEPKVEVVCRDDVCPLGKSIYSHGENQFNHVDLFQTMKSHHTVFHQCAGQVLATAQAGKKEEAKLMLTQGKYVRTSERVKIALARLFTQLSMECGQAA